MGETLGKLLCRDGAPELVQHNPATIMRREGVVAGKCVVSDPDFYGVVQLLLQAEYAGWCCLKRAIS